MGKIYKRNFLGYSLIETMTVIAVLGIVLGLLFAYQGQGWKLFYQSYGRGLSQVKAKLAIRLLTEDLIEANKSRISIYRGTFPGVPLPDDASDSSPYIYFTKPKTYEPTGDVISYDYVLYYFAKGKEAEEEIQRFKRRIVEKPKYLTLKSVKFLNQSKHFTEDEDKTWPFVPPIIELHKSNLPEDVVYLESLKKEDESESGSENPQEINNQDISQAPIPQSNATPKQGEITLKEAEEELFLDHFAKLKKYSRNIPLSGNFSAVALTEPFSKEEVNIFFGQDYKSDKPIKIKVSIEEPAFLLGLMSSMTEFEVTVTPRN